MKRLGVSLLIVVSLFMGVKSIDKNCNILFDNAKINIGQVASSSDEKGISILSIGIDRTL